MHVILGTGPLGRSVMKELQMRGEPYRIVNSSGRYPWTEHISVEKADLMDVNQAKSAIAGASVVYQCVQPPYHKWSSLFERLQENIIEAAKAANAKLVAAENMYMYGEAKGEIHEELPYVAATKKGRIRAKLAERLLDLHRRGELQVVIGRGSDFYGPGVTNSSAGSMMFRPLVSGKPVSILGKLDVKHTYTYIEDFGKALVTLGQTDNAYGEAWHVPNSKTVTVREFVELAAQLAGVKATIKPMGKGMLRIGGLFMPTARESIEMFYQFEKDFVISNRKYTERFGQPATPLDVALAATVEWYRKQI
ncbi:NAD-dependent epimerase/dehydratase family protein [Paenibacillus soyae]|uniref:NAD-dependent epimerase/dehydratase family protein n=1 Tax=Paenibacillus soyae TaxID=2969249 RepID=A0A9X2MXU5_9BACL|nr:NAD-dependent epimerase/dehydratase family protein [Paenibacillus soyae]MCR2805437.1 NAD-dependent epimerase/dehydratase family protein [Paenibacillus soyae]